MSKRKSRPDFSPGTPSFRQVTLEDAIHACRVALLRFYRQNGKVSREVWDGNYEAVHALESVLFPGAVTPQDSNAEFSR